MLTRMKPGVEFVAEQFPALGRIDAGAMVTHVVPLGEMPAAFEALRNPTHQCKVLARIGA